MAMTIVCTMTANAQKDVYFAKHRFVRNEYGELLPKKLDEAYCPTRIELDKDAKTLLVKTKTHGTESYTFSKFCVLEKKIPFFDEKGKIMGAITFTDFDCSGFEMLVIFKNDDTVVIYDSRLK